MTTNETSASVTAAVPVPVNSAASTATANSSRMTTEAFQVPTRRSEPIRTDSLAIFNQTGCMLQSDSSGLMDRGSTTTQGTQVGKRKDTKCVTISTQHGHAFVG